MRAVMILVVMGAVAGCGDDAVECSENDDGVVTFDCTERCQDWDDNGTGLPCGAYCGPGTCDASGWSADAHASCSMGEAICDDGSPVLCGSPLVDVCGR